MVIFGVCLYLQLFGLPGFVDTYQGNFHDDDEKRVLEIYGPQGLRKYLRTCLELSRY